jgi:hypothetical protein
MARRNDAINRAVRAAAARARRHPEKSLAHHARDMFAEKAGDALSGGMLADMTLGRAGMRVTEGHHRAEHRSKVVARHAGLKSVGTNRPGDCTP